MKATLSGMLAAVAVTVGTSVATDALAQSHGGRVVESKLAIYELVASKDVVTIYVDLKGKKGFTVKGAMASFEIVNANGQVIDRSKLLPGDGSILTARGPFKVGPGTKLVATIKFNNQPTEMPSWAFR